MSPSPDHDMPPTAATTDSQASSNSSSSSSSSIPAASLPLPSASPSPAAKSTSSTSPSSTPTAPRIDRSSASASSCSSTHLSSLPPAIAAPSHKRSREPSSMTDPSEAARYTTPPREMFRPSTTREEDDSETGSEADSVPRSDPTEHLQQHSHQPHQQEQHLTSLGQQLSLHSPGKTQHALADRDLDHDLDQDQEDQISAAMDSEITSVEIESEPNQGSETLENEPSLPSFDQQADAFLDMTRKPLVEGDPWYLIDETWIVAFRRYCTKMKAGNEDAAQHPGPIDNSLLFTNDGLRKDLKVKCVTQSGWDQLVSWYGTSTAPIMRRVVNTGSPEVPNLQIDYHPPVFTLYKVVAPNKPESAMMALNEPETVEMPRNTKMGDLKASLLARFGISALVTSRIWAFPSYSTPSTEGNAIEASEVLTAGGSCLESVEDDAQIVEVQELMKAKEIALEVQDDGEYLIPNTSTATSFITSLPTAYPRSLYGPRSSTPVSNGPPVEGICGLSNLGNTCFMNSALQCLSNTPDLTRYILAGAWRDELNRDNPLGMEGEVARAYANLIDKLWNGSNKVFSPREFKSTIGRFAPSFTGYHQHDSQELLAFLLDGLHEDLNRIIKKPYTEVPDSNGRPDEEVANDCWNIHKARNDSIIVDLFQGQYKSTLVCPECDKVSVTFDPFMYLSLPLPINKKWVGTVTYVPYDPSEAIVDVRLQLPKGSTIRHLKEKMAALMGTAADRLFVAEVFSHRFYKSYDNADAVDEISETDKNFVYELPVADFTATPDHVVFPVFNLIASSPTSYHTRPSAIGFPMMVCVTKEEALDPNIVYNAIIEQASRYTTLDLFKEDGSTETEPKPRQDLCQVGAYTPPAFVGSRYRSVGRSSLYAPATVPSFENMENIYERQARLDEEDSDDGEPYEPFDRHVVPRQNGRHQDLDHSLEMPDPGSPSTLSNSSRSSGRVPAPRPDDDELSEEDDPATLRQTPEPAPSNKTLRPRVVTPAVRPGEMIYCIWDRTLDSALAKPEPRYKYSRPSEDSDNEESAVRAIWDARGTPVIDPLLQEELASAKGIKKAITLEDCLSEYTKEEQLGEEDPWYCPNCKKHQQASKKLDIWRLPDILVVHLKRFSHTRAWRDKIDALVDFPIHGLDLSGKALKEEDREANVYDLFGVSNHMGGLGGGHYTAYAKNERLDQWYNFDDSHVSPVGNVDSIKTSSAYLLFYRRRNAAVREYEQRPATPASTSNLGRNLGGGHSESNNVLSLRSTNAFNGMDDDDSWPKEPFREIGPRQFAGHSLLEDDDDDELPSYNNVIPTSTPYTESLLFMSDKGKGKARSVDLDDAEEMDMQDGDLSTCASDGSNPATAQASPGRTPPSTSMIIGSYPPRTSISRDGGRIDDSDSDADMDDADEADEGYERVNLTMSMCERTDDEEGGADTASSTWQVLDRDDEEEDADVEDDVNLVTFQGAPTTTEK